MMLSVDNVITIEGERDHLPTVDSHVIRIEGFSENGEPFSLLIFSRERLEFTITDSQAESPDQGQLPLETSNQPTP